ncbi:uncharacterized protein M6B38_109630 [Iris pallida]|uniref:Uncharacterized protein n=1 Tax=Iris pallida TaxID=29817 RepID=A0AAX6E8Z8_IRIPA|nr:Uncharacterized protein M6B38_208995 [Iris pallida]KAJ6800410.1 uncharacterized protein M6B38_109630 [Iris pallida]
MGCVSSKIITKSASFRDDWSRLSFRRRKGDGVDELILSKNGGEQLVALLCTANSVARRLKEGSTPAHEQPDENKDSSQLEHSTEEAADKNQNDIEDQGSKSMISDSTSPSRRFRTIEDFDAMLAARQQSSGGSQSPVKCELDRVEPAEAKNRGGGDERPGSRRKAMAKELAALSIPSTSSSSFEFSRAGSRLLLGGQAPSPGSYVTPKFGNLDDRAQRAKEAAVAVFDPELIAHFEQAMEQLTMEEDRILEKIIEGLEEFSEEENLGELLMSACTDRVTMTHS